MIVEVEANVNRISEIVSYDVDSAIHKLLNETSIDCVWELLNNSYDIDLFDIDIRMFLVKFKSDNYKYAIVVIESYPNYLFRVYILLTSILEPIDIIRDEIEVHYFIFTHTVITMYLENLNILNDEQINEYCNRIVNAIVGDIETVFSKIKKILNEVSEQVNVNDLSIVIEQEPDNTILDKYFSRIDKQEYLDYIQPIAYLYEPSASQLITKER